MDLALDTLKIGKQALVFVATKSSAERCAELIAQRANKPCPSELAEKALSALPRPTSQCERLAKCLRKGIAFHHAGLHPKQKELIEDNFRSGNIGIICCTTTMAAGVDLPAFRSIIRDLKRYTARGMEFIPVLEYHQAAGRAGRPGMEEFGEAIAIAKTEGQADEIIEMFIKGKPENIYSKLAVEPVLRTYLLSLIATGLCRTEEQLLAFFSKTFWAKQYEDMAALNGTILRILSMLEGWGFITGAADEGFVSASDLNSKKLRATLQGKRVAELYLDPLTAHELVEGIKKLGSKATELSFVQLICSTLEMRPLLRVRQREYDAYQEFIGEHAEELVVEEPSYFDSSYEDFINSVKTSMMLMEWMDETDEEELMEKFGIRPGETRYKLEIGDWLFYSMKELATILNLKAHNAQIERLRTRLKYGVKDELIPLLRLKGIGRVRARRLFTNRIKDIGDIKRVSLSELTYILGEKTAKGIKAQVGEGEFKEELEDS